MKRCLITSAIALSAALAATATFAGSNGVASKAGTFYVNANGGMAIITGDVDKEGLHASEELKTGFDLGGAVGYNMTNNVSIEEAYNYVRNTFKDKTPAGNVSHYTQSLIMTNVKYHFNPMGSFSPFVGIGVGLDHLVITTDNVDPDSDSGHNYFAYQGILGLDYNINSNVAVGVNYHLLSSTTTEINHIGHESTPFTNLINASVTYTF